MTVFVVRSTCDHEGECDKPNEEPLIVLMFAESEPDQRKLIQLIEEAKPCVTQPMVGIVSENGSESAAIGESILVILQRFLAWKQSQKDIQAAAPPGGVAIVVEDPDPFSNLKEFDTDVEFGSGG